VKKIRLFSLVITSLMSLTLISSCKEDKCEGKQANAAFRMYQLLDYHEEGKPKSKEVEEDTFMIGTYVTFEATGYADSYEWQLGDDPTIRTGKKITLFFNPVELLETTAITVTLKAKNSANSLCFPGETKTSSKTITLLDNVKWPIFGKYYGSNNTNPNYKYTIEIFRGGRPTQPADELQMIRNLPGGDCNNLAGIGGAAFEFQITTSVPAEFFQYKDCVFYSDDKKIGRLSPDRQTITIDYIYTKISENNSKKYHQVFTGTRVK